MENNHFKKVKEYLLDLEYNIIEEDTEEQLFIVEKEEEGITNLIIDCEDPILVIELYLFEIKNGSEEMYKNLLMKNREIVHGAFALDEEGQKLIYRDTLELENLDMNELEGTLNSLSLFLSEYSEEIIKFSKQ